MQCSELTRSMISRHRQILFLAMRSACSSFGASRYLLVPAALAIMLAHLLVPANASAAECRFVLGFATLKALIDAIEGPEVVGECLENERTNPLNGDSLQHTTGGLMVWRKHDNVTVFTDGYRSWINGPYGLQERLNSERFDWETEPPPVETPEPAPTATPIATPTATPAPVVKVPRYVAQDSVAGDRAALIALYRATSGSNWTLKKNWLSNAPLGEWYGVRTNKRGRVTHVALVNNGLAGTIPQHLGNLSYLVLLNLGKNNLTGGIPVELGNLSDLEALKLEYNRLTGEVPSALGQLPVLKWVNIYGNPLRGCLPHALSRLRWIVSDLSLCRGGSAAVQDDAALVTADRAALVALYRATGGKNWDSNDNWLSDAPLGEWSGVQTNQAGRVIALTLSSNNLKGRLPPQLGNLTALQSLYALQNNLSGPIPPELGKLRQLNVLSLGSNELSGPIPAELGRLRNLTVLNVGVNRLSGRIPAALGALVNLKRLVLEFNALSGPIPSELGALHRLQKLKLEENNLTGAIPGELGRLTHLEWLMLAGNQLTGRAPTTLGNLKNLIRLELGEDNRLIGCLPVVAPHTDAPGLPLCAGAVKASPELLTTQLPPPPTSLRLDGEYRKYVDAGGIPIVAPIGVADESLLRARHILSDMLAARPQLYAALQRNRTRVVIGEKLGLPTDLPDFRNLGWYGRYNGFFTGGGNRKVGIPGAVIVVFEENLLCHDEVDAVHGKRGGTLVHEIAHAIHFAMPSSFKRRVDSAYRKAIGRGLWRGAYASTSEGEYWAEAVEAWFGVGIPVEGVTSRSTLRRYDPDVAALAQEVFGNAEVRAYCPTRLSFQGKVVGRDGRPLKDVRLKAVNFFVYHYGPNLYLPFETMTDAEGNFRLMVPKGYYTVEVLGDDGDKLGYYGGGGFVRHKHDLIPLEVSGAGMSGIRIVVP